jgi:acetylornithine/N-succinyldiaminopimelate aminotransferase
LPPLITTPAEAREGLARLERAAEAVSGKSGNAAA